MPKRIEIEGEHLRVRIRDPKKFTKFRTQDVGDLGHTQRVAGWSKKSGWQTQAWIFKLEDVESRRKKTMKVLRKLNVGENDLKRVGL